MEFYSGLNGKSNAKCFKKAGIIMQMRKFSFFLPSPFVLGAIVGLGLLFWAVCAKAEAQPDWRIKIMDAAVVNGANVRLGEIAEPLGNYPQAEWEKLKNKELWPSPQELGKPMSISKNKLKEQIRGYLGDTERICIYPSSLALQQGGALVREGDLRGLVVKYLTNNLMGLPGEVNFSDIKTPAYIFLSSSQQQVVPSMVSKVSSGRMSLRFEVLDIDGTPLRRYTGSAFVDLWVNVPCASTPLNKDDQIDVDKIVFMRKNMAHIRGNLEDVWDGRGGPYRVMRSIGSEQVIYTADLSGVPTVRRGRTVNLIYNKGNIKLTVTAQAQDDAGLGDVITVRNMQSKKLVSATVQSADTVLIN